jgi:phage shock protein PspC (stress-responsive transcriptional regulator)
MAVDTPRAPASTGATIPDAVDAGARPAADTPTDSAPRDDTPAAAGWTAEPIPPPATERPRPRLHRSARERVVSGVCGGLAEYFEIDPVFVRLAFVLITLAGGAGVVAYIILAIVLPVEEAAPDALETHYPGMPDEITVGERRRRHQQIGALVLVGLGLVLLAGNLDWFPHLRGDILWPLVLVAAGVLLLARRQRPRGSARRANETRRGR